MDDKMQGLLALWLIAQFGSTLAAALWLSRSTPKA